MTKGIFLLLGGNLGKPQLTFEKANAALANRHIPIVASSGIYKTAAWGKEDQPDFLNQVIQIASTLPPQDLLATILLIENLLGRVRDEKWGPRIIDIDILYYNQEIVKEAGIIIPHPEIQNRRFALMPLCEIAPEFIHPVYKKNQRWLLANCKDDLRVENID